MAHQMSLKWCKTWVEMTIMAVFSNYIPPNSKYGDVTPTVVVWIGLRWI